MREKVIKIVIYKQICKLRFIKIAEVMRKWILTKVVKVRNIVEFSSVDFLHPEI